MSTTIPPELLKSLRVRQNLSQGDLERKAAENKTPVSLSTIKRLEDKKRARHTVMPRVLKALAAALNVDEGELTGNKVSPRSKDTRHLGSFVPVKDKIDRQTDLSFQAVEAIYGISRSAQIAMAPLFSALLAESSLKWRKDRLVEIGTIAGRLDNLRGDNLLLNGAFSRTWEAEKLEQWSIEAKDVLGHRAIERLDEDFPEDVFGLEHNHDGGHERGWACKSPFKRFLQDLASRFDSSPIEIDGANSADEYMPDGLTEYRIGEALIDEICANSRWARIAIEFGHAAIKDIPSELLGKDKVEERREFLKSRISEADRIAHVRANLELNNKLRAEQPLAFDEDDREPIEITPELLERALKRLNKNDVSDRGDEQ